ncbi:MAG: hypothetical protein M5U19_04765 [Microthrixaceae bacterium]|nr:hypothetical protein [Microthrixaceae bacterium]
MSSDVVDEVRDLADGALGRLVAAASVEELDALDRELLGKRSRLTEMRASLRDADPNSERSSAGRSTTCACSFRRHWTNGEGSSGWQRGESSSSRRPAT